ncbi:MAG: carbon-nitrogen hydrolase [Armatimonadetes bacterium]|nr:carbon-nitrogen hydrolase [Armatimonadota bacterium]
MRLTDRIRVRLVQMAPRLGDLEANMRSHVSAARRAIEDGVDLLIFPELSLTGYYLRDLTSDIALTTQARELRELSELSQSIALVAGMVEEGPRFGLFASALYYERGHLAHVHRKVYLPTYGMFDEGRYLSPGNTVRAFDSRFGKAGILICEDVWHPMLPFILAQEGIMYLVVTANSPTRGPRPEGLVIRRVYEEMLATYARLFQVYICFCNRVGYEDGVNFWGGSFVVSPSGEIIARGPKLEAAEVDAEIVPGEVRRERMKTPLVGQENLDLALRELRRIADDRPGH